MKWLYLLFQDGVVVIVFASHVVGCGFAPWLGHPKDHHKGQVVCGTVYGDIHYNDLLVTIERVGHRIPVLDFYVVLHGLRCQKAIQCIKRAGSRRSLGYSEIVLKKRFAIECYEAALYTSMNFFFGTKRKKITIKSMKFFWCEKLGVLFTNWPGIHRTAFTVQIRMLLHTREPHP